MPQILKNVRYRDGAPLENEKVKVAIADAVRDQFQATVGDAVSESIQRALDAARGRVQ